MAVLKIVYTEEDKSVQLYRDCDIEKICWLWLDKLVEAKDTSLVFQLTTAQELVITTMQMLLVRDFSDLSYEDVLFFMEDEVANMGNRLGCRWMFIDTPFPALYPHYSSYNLDTVLGL